VVGNAGVERGKVVLQAIAAVREAVLLTNVDLGPVAWTRLIV
jgi:hypothetical protein